MSAYRIIREYQHFKTILQTPNFKKPKIFNKFNSDKKLKAMEEFSNLVGISINEGFQNALEKSEEKTAQRLLSSKKFDLNYKDSTGNSVLMNILQSQNTSLLKDYFNKAEEETGFKLFPLIPNNSGNTIYNIAAAADDKKVSKILYHKIAELHDLNKIEIQSSANKIDLAPPAYSTLDHNTTPDTLYEAELNGATPSAPSDLLL